MQIAKTATHSIFRYVGPLPSGNDVKVDITLRDIVAFPLQERAILRGYDEFTDLPENHFIRAYSLEEITTEKTPALADQGSQRAARPL